jgi:hypothetical protein
MNSSIAKVTRVLSWAALPFKLLWQIVCFVFGVCRRFTGKPRFKLEEAAFYSVHKSFYLWGLIVLGWFTSLCLRIFPSWAGALTWLYVWALFYTFLLFLFDLGTIKIIVCSLIIFFLCVTFRYVEAVQKVSVLGWIYSHFAGRPPVMNEGLPHVVSWLLFVPWVIMAVESYRVGKKTLSPNGIEERHLLVGNEITDRAGLRFVSRYPDLLESVLGFGAGSIVAYDGQQKVVKEWNNILGLFFIWNRLDEIMHQRSAVVDNAPNDPVEVEEVAHVVKGQ